MVIAGLDPAIHHSRKKKMEARVGPAHDGVAAMTNFHLRPYAAADEDAAIELWRRTWQQAYPDIDFAARVDWWRARWRDELVPKARIVVAEHSGALAGFVTIDDGGYLDQIVVAPEAWGSLLGTMLLDEARRLSPSGVSLLVNTDNARAIRFYQRNGFAISGEDVNPTSGRPVLKMAWMPRRAGEPPAPGTAR